MKRTNRISSAISALVLASALASAPAALGQQFSCYAIADSTDALLAAGAEAPYYESAMLPVIRLAVHALHESNGTGGYAQASIDSLLSRLLDDFGSTQIRFMLVGRYDINNSAYLSSPIDSAATLFVSYSDSTRIDIFLGENAGPVSGTTAGIPSTALVLTGAACGSAALSHFVGHCLGLYETTETTFGIEEEDGSNGAVAGDLVMDTSVMPDTENILEGVSIESWTVFTEEQGRRMLDGIERLADLAKLEHDSGITYKDGSSETEMVNAYTGVPANATAVDLNSDGKLDLAVLGSRSAFTATTYDLATGVPEFSDATDATFPGGIKTAMAASNGAIAADYDNDGDLDLYVPNSTQHMLLRSSGPDIVAFTDVTNASGLLDGQSSWSQSISGSWGDYNQDGSIDLLILTKNSASGEMGSGYVRLLHNDGDETFSDETSSQVGISGSTTNIGSALWADFNMDNHIDLLLVQTGPYSQRQGSGIDGDKSKYFLNDGDGTFTDVTSHTSGVRLQDENLWKFKYNRASLADVQPDGEIDVVFADVDGNGFYENSLGLINYGWVGLYGYGTGPGECNNCRETIDVDVCDYDLDGRPDFVYTDPDEYPIANLNFVPTLGPGPVQFTSEVHDFTVQAIRYSGGAAVADFDRNGTSDIYTSRSSASTFYYYPKADDDHAFGNWVGVSLRSFVGTCNRFGIGATVVVSHGAYLQAQVVDGGSGGAGQNPLDLVFGLGSYSGTVDITVYWSDGTTVQEYVGATPGQYYTLGQYAIAPSSIGFTKIYDPYLDMYTWEFKWDTDIKTDVAGDMVTVTPPASPPECIGPEFTLSAANAYVSVGIVKVGNKFRHTVSMTGGTCTEGCRYSYTVKSSLLGVESPDLTTAKTFKISSCVVVP